MDNKKVLFKAKDSKGNWVDGYYYSTPAPPVCFKEDTYTVKDSHYIMHVDKNYVPDWGMPYKMVSTTIDPRTLCIYTGQCEYSIENGFKRDNKIFDNDIVEIWADRMSYKTKSRHDKPCKIQCKVVMHDGQWELEVLDNEYNRSLLEKKPDETVDREFQFIKRLAFYKSYDYAFDKEHNPNYVRCDIKVIGNIFD